MVSQIEIHKPSFTYCFLKPSTVLSEVEGEKHPDISWSERALRMFSVDLSADRRWIMRAFF